MFNEILDTKSNFYSDKLGYQFTLYNEFFCYILFVEPGFLEIGEEYGRQNVSVTIFGRRHHLSRIIRLECTVDICLQQYEISIEFGRHMRFVKYFGSL